MVKPGHVGDDAACRLFEACGNPRSDPRGFIGVEHVLIGLMTGEPG